MEEVIEFTRIGKFARCKIELSESGQCYHGGKNIRKGWSHLKRPAKTAEFWTSLLSFQIQTYIESCDFMLAEKFAIRGIERFPEVWLIDWSIDWLIWVDENWINWSFDWLIDLFDRLIEWLIDGLIDWFGRRFFSVCSRILRSWKLLRSASRKLEQSRKPEQCVPFIRRILSLLNFIQHFYCSAIKKPSP